MALNIYDIEDVWFIIFTQDKNMEHRKQQHIIKTLPQNNRI